MDEKTALAAFKEIESLRVTATSEEETVTWQETPFDVRLDAGTVNGLDVDQEEGGRNGGGSPYCYHRTWRIFVKWSGTGWTFDDSSVWKPIVEIAERYDLDWRPENGGLELT